MRLTHLRLLVDPEVFHSSAGADRGSNHASFVYTHPPKLNRHQWEVDWDPCLGLTFIPSVWNRPIRFEVWSPVFRLDKFPSRFERKGEVSTAVMSAGFSGEEGKR